VTVRVTNNRGKGKGTAGCSNFWRRIEGVLQEEKAGGMGSRRAARGEKGRDQGLGERSTGSGER